MGIQKTPKRFVIIFLSSSDEHLKFLENKTISFFSSVIVLFWSSTPHGQQSLKGSSIPTSSMASPVTSVGIGMQTIQTRSSDSHSHLQNPSPAHVSIQS